MQGLLQQRGSGRLQLNGQAQAPVPCIVPAQRNDAAAAAKVAAALGPAHAAKMRQQHGIGAKAVLAADPYRRAVGKAFAGQPFGPVCGGCGLRHGGSPFFAMECFYCTLHALFLQECGAKVKRRKKIDKSNDKMSKKYIDKEYL